MTAFTLRSTDRRVMRGPGRAEVTDEGESVNLVLWIIAGLLAAVFLVAGVTKLFIPQERLAKLPAAEQGHDKA